ncbi:MAG TPA: hypothetical protein VGH80_07215 [Xanthomonadaceae bacterium]|jgi:hypothetical protein
MQRPAAAVLCLLLATMLSAGCAAAETETETIVLVRHGEKQSDGLGQLDCQGLNRALALPKVIQALFGKPDAVFAPDPAKSKPDHFKSYDYVRPLATIEPTAIRFGLAVNTQFGYSDTRALVAELEKPAYRKALVLVAWEHVELVKAASALLSDNGGDASQLPAWHYDDFDGIYVIRISRVGGSTHAGFEHLQEHLDGQPERCPGEN